MQFYWNYSIKLHVFIEYIQQKWYNLKSTEILEKLMYYIASNNTQTFSYSGMTGNFSIDTVTLISYVGYLKQAFLINVLENYSTKEIKKSANPTKDMISNFKVLEKVGEVGDGGIICMINLLI